MKALSIRQPWADAILFDGKDIENRSWKTAYRGPLLIHAASQPLPRQRYREARSLINSLVEVPTLVLSQIPRYGAIVGVVDLVDIVTESSSPWFSGPYGWVLSRPRPIIGAPFRGRLGLFEVDPVSLGLEIPQ